MRCTSNGYKTCLNKWEKYNKRPECKEPEFNFFLQHLNKSNKTAYHIVDCPDKSGQDYNCDLVIENEQSEKIYIEIKGVLFGYNKINDNEIAENNGQNAYASLITTVIDECSTNIKGDINKYVIKIPPEKKDSNNKKFCQELKDFLYKTDFEDKVNKEFKHIRENGSELKIEFEPKTSDMNKLSKGYIYMFPFKKKDHTGETKKSIKLSEMQKYLSDNEELAKLICHNCMKTKSEKFPKTSCRKILLNLLKLPLGYEVVFEKNMNLIINSLEKDLNKFKCAADEIYLLYYSEKFTSNLYRKCEIEPGETILFIWKLYDKKTLHEIEWQYEK